MFRSLELHRPSRRVVVAAILGVLAVLLALAVTIDPNRATSSGPAAGGTSSEIDDDTPATTLPDALDEAIAGKALEDPVDMAVEAEQGSGGDAAARDVAGIAATTDSIAASPTASSLAPPTLDTKIVRTGTIALDVKRGAFEDAWGEAQSVATSHGGYIVLASRSGAGDSARTGSITMRVPTDRFEDALERMRKVDGAKVDALDVSSQDVTQEYVDVRSRLRHDRAVERRLLALLSEAEGVSEVLAVQSRLDSVQEQIEVARGRLQYLDKLTAMSTIQVTLTAPSARSSKADEAKDEPGTIAAAFEDARERFSENVAAAIVWVGGALPTLLLLAVLGIVGRLVWHRFDVRRTERDRPVVGE